MSANISFLKYDDSYKEIWESINKDTTSTFLSSIDWINFQKSLGKEVHQYLIKKEDKFIGNFYIEVFRRRIAKYAYSPYGPVLNIQEQELEEVYNQIKTWQIQFAKEHNLNCFRIDPLIDAKYLKVFKSLGYKKSMAPTQAKYIWEIDITKSEDELLAEMKKVTRYNIKNSAKSGIEIIKANSEEEVIEFFNILTDTTKRHSFASFSLTYFVKQFQELKDSEFNLYLAKYGNKFISGALINTYNHTGYYSHGGSLADKQLQKYGASYLLHWEIIKDLKQRGFNKYNMWGVVPENINVKNGMKGVSEFKRKFGGYELDYVGGLDVQANPLYLVQRIAEGFIYKNDRY